ncbi:hypothetical protein [Bartonella sp. A05]|uniref:hypothetical protein n=1 Tax=Bartonella sp. A05 TaxID=2967261 RepID=UPI0022A9CE1F|nr:hypothetical protein [Bartonella sp. A05]MCZ2203312.1 hypothetical protein [Bartonella sp. A05]
MVDFVKILKKAINAKNNSTSQSREQIYERAVETLEHKLVEAEISKAVANAQRQALKRAIITVEEEYEIVEKGRLFSLVGWKQSCVENGDENKQSFTLSQDNGVSVLVREKEQESSGTSLIDNEIVNKSSIYSRVPNAEPVNMDVSSGADAHQAIQKNKSESEALASALQTDGSHIVARIFSQTVQRAPRPSMQKRIMIGFAVFVSCILFFSGIFFVGEYISVLNNNQQQGEEVQVVGAVPKAVVANRKLTKRLLEDGSEIDVGPSEEVKVPKEEEVSNGVAINNVKPVERLGEAILYKMRTDYDTEKVATGNVQWSLVRESSAKGGLEELVVRGDITIPDEGLSLRLTLQRNTDVSLPAAYIIDLIFILSDKFSGQSISNIKTLTFKASEQSIGHALTRTVAAKIDDNFFLFALSGNHPFLDRNLQLMRKLDWIRLVMTDKNGRVNELTFAKGPRGQAIFNEVIGQWQAQTDKQAVLY